MTHSDMLADLGWSAFYLSQLDLEELPLTRLRVAEVHRTRISAVGGAGLQDLPLPPPHATTDFAVGDWVLAGDDGLFQRRLERRTLLQRRAAGSGAAAQLIAANVDSLFIVTSCNADFNLRRLERYLALAAEAGCEPVVILTKSDRGDPEPCLRQAAGLKRGLAVVALDARDAGVPGLLTDWCRRGQTVALLGSSGVGKSTLTGTLTGVAEATAPIREEDARGRHTTTFRALRPMSGGGWVIDTPGMRALRLTDAADGIDALFADISDLVPLCRFSDCGHDSEPGCAVQAAIAAGELEAGRLARWRKLKREDRFNSETIAEAHARHRAFGRMQRNSLPDKVARRDKG